MTSKRRRRPNPRNEDDLTQKSKTTKHSVRFKSLKARIQTMSFPTYINFQVNNTGDQGGLTFLCIAKLLF